MKPLWQACVYAAVNLHIGPLGPLFSGTFANSALREEYQSACGKWGIFCSIDIMVVLAVILDGFLIMGHSTWVFDSRAVLE